MRCAAQATVSTLKEAEQFFLAGVHDILYAVGIAPNKPSHVQRLRTTGLELSLVLDNVQAATCSSIFSLSGDT